MYVNDFIFVCCSGNVEMIDYNLHESQLFAYTVLDDWNPGQCKEGVAIFYSMFDNVVSLKCNKPNKS